MTSSSSPQPTSTTGHILRSRWPALGSLAGYESTRFLGKWILIGSLIGVVAGLGAVAFSWAIEWCTHFFLGDVVGYMPPMPIGEGSPVRGAMERPWLLPIVTALGGLIAGIIVFRLAPEAEGHGTDAAIDAIHHKGARINPRVPPVKLVASAITIGSGGSGGREGPAAQISSGFASMLSGWLKLNITDRRIAVISGMSAGIGAIFRAPLGGSLMGAEILYLHDLEVEALIPSLIASIVAYSVYGMIEGFDPIFGAQPGLGFSDPVTLVYYAGLGVIAGLVGLLYAKTFYGVSGIFHRWHIPVWSKPAIGGFLVGIMGLFVAGSIHTGYGWVQISMTDELLDLPLWLVLSLPFAKILATSFSIGSGGSGGIFGPGMVIGGMLGAACWRLGEGALPHFPDSPAPFVIVGMMALFGSIAHAPFAVMLMVAEMTENLSLLAPAMIAIAVATLLVGDHSIYWAQIPNRATSPTHRLAMRFPLLAAMTARSAMRPVDVAEATSTSAPRIDVRTPLDEALMNMAEAETTTATIVDGRRIVGTLTYRDAMVAYRAMLESGLEQAERLPITSMLLDFTVGTDAPVAHQPLRDVVLPASTLVVAVRQRGEPVFPQADTVLKPGDKVTVMASPDQASALRLLLT
jgi:CIC family chloride channel protein